MNGESGRLLSVRLCLCFLQWEVRSAVENKGLEAKTGSVVTPVLLLHSVLSVEVTGVPGKEAERPRGNKAGDPAGWKGGCGLEGWERCELSLDTQWEFGTVLNDEAKMDGSDSAEGHWWTLGVPEEGDWVWGEAASRSADGAVAGAA